MITTYLQRLCHGDQSFATPVKPTRVTKASRKQEPYQAEPGGIADVTCTLWPGYMYIPQQMSGPVNQNRVPAQQPDDACLDACALVEYSSALNPTCTLCSCQNFEQAMNFADEALTHVKAYVPNLRGKRDSGRRSWLLLVRDPISFQIDPCTHDRQCLAWEPKTLDRDPQRWARVELCHKQTTA